MMRAFLVLREHPTGVELGPGNHVVYDLAGDSAHFGAAEVAGPALSWELVLANSTEPEGSNPAVGPSGNPQQAPGSALDAAAAQAEANGNSEPGTSHMALAAPVELGGPAPWLMRCDRVDFPPGAVAHRHVHPGPGIRRLLFGELTITTGGVTTLHRAGGAWFESGPEPVYAESSPTEATAFVRVILLPSEWAGKRTIRYTNPADASRPTLQRAHVYLEEILRLPSP